MKKVIIGFALLATSLAVGLAGHLKHVKADDGWFDFDHFHFYPGNLVLSRSVYDNNANNIPPGTVLPPDCPSTASGCNTTPAPYSGTYPEVFNNDLYDGSFGITSKIYLDQITPYGWWINTLPVPTNPDFDHLVTSFSSKSELALNLSTDGKYLTFMGYVAPINALDVSNSNTPGVVDPTNPVGISIYRAVGEVDANGNFEFTETNAYSGNNGRAAIYNRSNGDKFYYTAGNAGNGSNPQPAGVILGAGSQILSTAEMFESKQTPGTPTPVGSFNITEIPASTKTDKIGKDDNFRGLTIYNNVVYYTKGSGGNGINTVYFIDTTGTACPQGVGVPAAGAKLPTVPLSYTLSTLQTNGLPSNMCVLAGFPTALAKSFAGYPTGPNPAFPFGIWFANANTLYVADEGDGYAGGTDLDTHAASETTAGLQKWVFNSATKTWSLAYVLQKGLELGVPYTVPGYPTGLNLATCVLPKTPPPSSNPNNCALSSTVTSATAAPNGLPWSPATDGLRNITGHVNWDGTVTIWGITSTVSGAGDQGADPNRLVAITDGLANTSSSVAASESFHILRTAGYAEVLRGVSFTPGSNDENVAGFFWGW